MVNGSQPVSKITSLTQVCMVVNDIDKSMESLWKTFGIGPWNVSLRDFNSKIDGETISNMTYRGKPAQFGYKMAGTQNKLGDIYIELIQPTAGDNIYRDFLRENGEGIQHLGWQVVDTQKEFAETWKKLEAAGFPCIQSGHLYSTDFAYFDTTKALNTILEVVWRDPTKKRPAPKYVYPKP